MKPKTLTDKVIKAHYGKFRLSKNTCQCMEICIETLGVEWFKQVEKMKWQIDLECKDAIDVQLYKIGRKAMGKYR